MNKAKKINGFTLIELMISVAIVGILASIAYPSYQSSVQKSHRSDVQANLLNLVNVMERRYTEKPDYTLVPAPPPTPYYTIAINPVTATTYTLSATPIVGSGQDGDPCGTLTIDNFGTKGGDISGCW
ncbi:MAG: type IV pilin protein [Methylovulum sp.]|uniref:type IV pilin protein n=1 Tax=Methylovulum sp. TaxID=1916980 RepID=UPI002628AD41|nr:type IV pilin protein [Methylovulum sp.]MDD2724762.1 type IV pilin protein [Methylovulum sp.]MDD5124370.1 type IV pilin protein [Methylovulum sp.]